MKRIVRSALLAAALAVPASAFAQDEVNRGNISVDLGIDYVTAYVFRGYVQEDARFIVQPYGEIGIGLVDSDDFTLSANIGVWTSVHELPTPGTSNFFEADYYAGLTAGFGAFEVGLVYTLYTYPGNAAADIHEIGISLSVDDSKLGNDKFPLNPYIAAYFEIDDLGGSNDSYLEIGVEPTIFTLFEGSDRETEVTLPVVAGFSLDDYYFNANGGDKFWGYISVGLSAAVPLAIPPEYGQWSLVGGVNLLYLNAESAREANNDDRWKVVGSLGVAMSY